MTEDREKVVLITGRDGKRWGEPRCGLHRRGGTRVSFLYHRAESRAHTLAETFGATPIQADLSRPIDLANCEFDVLINGAAINETSDLTGDLHVEDWNRTIALNLTAPFLLIQQCLPHMVRQHWGRIVNISSIYGASSRGNKPPVYGVQARAFWTDQDSRPRIRCAWHHV